MAREKTSRQVVNRPSCLRAQEKKKKRIILAGSRTESLSSLALNRVSASFWNLLETSQRSISCSCRYVKRETNPMLANVRASRVGCLLSIFKLRLDRRLLFADGILIKRSIPRPLCLHALVRNCQQQSPMTSWTWRVMRWNRGEEAAVTRQRFFQTWRFCCLWHPSFLVFLPEAWQRSKLGGREMRVAGIVWHPRLASCDLCPKWALKLHLLFLPSPLLPPYFTSIFSFDPHSVSPY